MRMQALLMSLALLGAALYPAMAAAEPYLHGQ